MSNLIQDPLGRYVLQGFIYSEQWTFLNIYAPNYDDHLFMQTIFLSISQASGSVLVGGDFNFCMDTVLDRSSPRPQPPTKAAKLSKTYMKDLKLVDIWRQIHPSDRDYSFYSHPHNITHTRIDYFLLSTKLVYRVLAIDYLPRLLSDHSPLMSCPYPCLIKQDSYTDGGLILHFLTNKILSLL